MDLRTTWLWRSTTKQKYSQEFIHPLILSPTPTYWNWKKKLKKRQKKTEFVFHLVLLGIIKRKPEAATNDQLTKQAPNCIQTQTFHSLLFRGSVLPLAVVVPTFLCSRTLSTSELNFGGGLESTSSVEWKPRGTAPPQCESSKWKDFKKTYLYPNHTSP